MIYENNIVKGLVAHFPTQFDRMNGLDNLITKYFERPLDIELVERKTHLEKVVLLHLKKAIITFRSIKLLSEFGHSFDSIVLCRTIYENLLSLLFILKDESGEGQMNSEEKARMFKDYDYKSQAYLFEYEADFRPYLKEVITQKQKDELTEKLEEVYKRYPHFSGKFRSFGWIKDGEDKLRKLIVDSDKSLKFFHMAFYWFASKFVHPDLSVFSLYFTKTDSLEIPKSGLTAEVLTWSVDLMLKHLDVCNNFLNLVEDKTFSDLFEELYPIPPSY